MSALSPETRKQQEMEELSAVLSCSLLSRSPNLSRILAFICDRYFQGEDSITEFEIATKALGRRETFNPLDDATVRVNIHNLRKKLHQYYQDEGAPHAIQIELPVGRYLPHFFDRMERAEKESGGGEGLFSAPQPPLESVPPAPGSTVAVRGRDSNRWWTGAVTGLVLLVVSLAVLIPSFRTLILGHDAGVYIDGRASQKQEIAVRIAAGMTTAHADRFGNIWFEDRWFNGGRAATVPNVSIGRGADPELYEHSREGNFSYDIPLPRGKYELHLYFAETTYKVVQGRVFSISINDKVVKSTYDVVVDGGAPAVATAKVFIDVEPAADGKLHLGFRGAPPESQNALINGIEILPGTPGRMRPILQTVRNEPYIDAAGQHWAPDEWFDGGRTAVRGSTILGVSDPNLFTTERAGTFNYAIPVVDHHLYKVTLYFSESWFLFATQPKIGDRVFDVYCNGVALLTNFDIMKTTGLKNVPVIRSFEHIQPNPQSKIALTFVPRANLATINAIQIEDQGPAI